MLNNKAYHTRYTPIPKLPVNVFQLNIFFSHEMSYKFSNCFLVFVTPYETVWHLLKLYN